MGRYKELAPDISDEDLARIPLESTGSYEAIVQSKVFDGHPSQLSASGCHQETEGSAKVHIQENHHRQHVEQPRGKDHPLHGIAVGARGGGLLRRYLLKDEGASLAYS